MKFQSYGAVGVLSLCLLSTSALANSTGITDHSGKTASKTCNSCHNGGSAPTVEITGPSTLAASASGEFTLIIRGGAAVIGGTNIAVSNTAAALEPVTGSGLRKSGTELTHSAAKSFTNGELRFNFTMMAPSTAGTVSIFGAGNSANGAAATAGDMGATTKLDVTVTGGTGGGTDGGTGGGTDAGTGSGGGDGDEDKGGCSSTGGAPVLMFALAAAGMTLLRRRRS
ncbi:MXAN_6652 family MXYO-CTERM-anchored protein [Archangium sp.]|uniref:MXAN_6652 family MXYO-CTERM-anchored protein n=1 Tax=Archangium sp. TaxID=1872627 RepID=UPI00286BECBE|nr:MXAN_6652 family MXYO-CTERM-anchored protein [Archangium sp.]